jgi:HAD superfamily hydrolase (TIGR01509 family)
MPVETLFLDAGGVLVHPNWWRVSAALAAEGIPVTAEHLALADPRARKALDQPQHVAATDDRSRARGYLELVLQEAGVPPSPRAAAALATLRVYHERQNLWEHVPGDVVPMLERLRGRGRRLVVVSNSNGTLCTHFERLGLARCVDHMLDSHEHGVEKPDPRFFQLALARAGAEPGTTLHVGDLYHVDVAGARAAGLRAVLFDAAGLYPEADCPRVSSLSELADALDAGTWG